MQGKHFCFQENLRHIFKSTFNPDQDLGPLQYLLFIKSDEVFDRSLQVEELSEKLSLRVNAF